jgi:hypothetical protein
VAINPLNRQLTTRIPNNFIDRAALVANANQTGMDQADRAADVVPGSLRVDSQHLSSGGYRIVAHQVGNSFVATAGRNQIRYLESESQRSASNDTAGKSLMADKQPFAGASRMALHGRHLPVPPMRTGNRAEKLGRSPEETEQLSMFSYALRGEVVKISSRAAVSEISWPFVDQLNVMGEIQAAGKIELLIRLHRSGMSALLP